MRHQLSIFSIAFMMLLLSGCATTGSDAPSLRAGTDGSQAATQASAQTIAPITSYISNVR